MGTKFFCLFFSFSTLFCLNNISAVAQITTDRSLPVNSIVNSDGNLILINGGTQGGTNLFHSFQEFSIEEGQTAIFNNSQDILNIFSRVTGNSISTINGILSANGIANLFLMNPNGIVFGPNATIAIGGSFFGTTANRIVFADGFEFNAKGNNSGTPLMTIDRPLGMGFSDSREIMVQGRGHEVRLATESLPNALGNPIDGGGESRNGLRTAPLQTLALIGGDITVDGGILTAFSGQIELGSVLDGFVSFFPSSNGYIFEYSANKFNDITLTQQALLDASGLGNGKINLTGKNIFLQDGSVILVSNFGNSSTNEINIKADSAIFTGISDFAQFPLEQLNSNTFLRGIYTQAFAEGKSANVNILVENISLQNFSTIQTLSFAQGDAGLISIEADGTIKIDGNNPYSFFLPSSIISVSSDRGKTGDILAKGNNIVIQNGGIVLLQNLGTGDGGSVEIEATEKVELSGAIALNPERTEFAPSTIASTISFSENQGNVKISTKNLTITNGGQVNANTLGTGNGGDIIINTDILEIDGQAESTIESFSLGSQISSRADIPSPFFQEVFGFQGIPSGDAGSIEINAQNITISNSGRITVSNEGTGEGGNIKINSEEISLINNGAITAETISGRGGNISIKGKDLSLINNSRIEATAGGKGDGGNIVINSGSVFMENSHIKADAIEGNGGNILINTEVFLISSDSAITATSELGVDGIVEINTPDRNLESIIKPVRATILDVDLRIIQECVDDKGEKALVVMKVPGMPEFPLEEKPSNYHDPNLPQFIEISKYISEADKEFYLDNLPGNTILRTEDGTPKFVNLCLRDLIEEQQNQ